MNGTEEWQFLKDGFFFLLSLISFFSKTFRFVFSTF